ncbi:hypothetical protein D9611_004892 [Ephemerocybe angulata]|uniref:Vacuolar import and degradation protein n=1 Tax=Ephemerocybe angulata TaxID=980116 RepID=A0A8H5B3D6_9AGAR|nr:hypothetical protein D9611_004892 [Tulosesus angulatus]
MPSEHLVAVAHDQQPEQVAQQIKFCSLCHSTLVDHASIFLPDADALVCPTCRDHIRTPRLSQQAPGVQTVVAQQDQRASRIDSHYINRPPPSHEVSSRRPPPSDINPSSLIPDNTISSQVSPATNIGQQQEASVSYHHPAPIAGPSSSQQPQSSPCSPSQASCSKTPSSLQQVAGGASKCSTTNNHVVSTPPSMPALTTSAVRRPQQPHQYRPQPHLDPLADITRLRVRSQGHHCLYPGATFDGTQKSGRNSYEVNVTIVDVDFSSSFLCGYLRIRGLTDDWPELTTYFDAEIIGSRYGFLTQNWGATEHEDMVHWARFPAFKHVRGEAKKPHMTIDDRDRGAVFMRWKEKFLVPDHRVQDISGASFAGFYYVCVDFNSHSSQPAGETDDGDVDESGPGASPTAQKSDSGNSTFQARRRRASSTRRRSPSAAPRAAPVATMSGFYYHANSEPYQQLSLTHVAERTSSTFEFR